MAQPQHTQSPSPSKRGKFSGRPLVWLMEDPRLVRLYESFSYTTLAGQKHVAPAGFIFDGASIPRFFWRTIGPPLTGKHRYAAIIHDILCHQARQMAKADPTEGAERRAYADEIFREMLEVSGVGRTKCALMYRGVRIDAKWAGL